MYELVFYCGSSVMMIADIKDDSETIEGRIRQLSMKIWKAVSEKLKTQIISHKGFSQSLISSIHNSLNGTMTSLTLKR